MSDFKSYIKDRYNQEVQPKFSEEEWDKFAAYANIKPEKSNRKWLIWLFFGLLLTAVSSVAYYINKHSSPVTVAKTSVNYQENDDLIARDESDVVDAAQYSTSNDQSEDIDTQSDNIPSDGQESTTITQSENIATGSYDSQNVENQYSSIADTGSTNQNSQTDDLSSLQENTSEVSEVNPLLTPGTEPTSITKKFRTPILMSLLPVKQVALLSSDPVLIENNKITPIHLVESPGFLFAGIDLGTGRSYHRSIDDHGVYLFSGHLGYGINDRFRIRASAGITQSRYSSRVLNRSLGLRSINYPVREARLDNVNSTTTYVETGIGVEYTTPTFAGFSITGGPGLLLVKEFNRKLDYNFNQGDMDLESINVDVEDHPTHPVNLSVNLGINYYLSPDLYFTFKGEYLKTLKQSDVELLMQARIKLGMEKKF